MGDGTKQEPHVTQPDAAPSPEDPAEAPLDGESLKALSDIRELLLSEMDGLTHDLLSSELGSLERISSLTESIQGKLDRLYAHKFPKSCSSCGRIYETRESYLRATRDLIGKNTVMNRVGVQEYRNCECGSTLLVWTQDRRDNSDFGKARRDLFDVCLAKMKTLSTDDEATLRARLRRIFRGVADRVESRKT